MSEIYQERNFENEVPNLKGTLNPDEFENNNKISSSSNNSIVIHSEKVSNVENVEKNIKTEKSSSNLIGSNCNYANSNTNEGSNMYNLVSKKNSVIENQSLNQNQNFYENLSLIENNQNENENNQNENENNQNENEIETVGNENKKEIIKIKNDIKKSLENYLEKLIDEKKGDFILNGFSKIKVINNKNKEIEIIENGNELKINFNYKKDFNGNYKWKFISIDNFNLNKETIEKYSLKLIEKKCVYSLNKKNLIEFNFDLNDNSKKFLIFAIGLYDNNNILFTNTIILFFINLKNCKK